MHILLTGATGFLGWRTLEVLVQDPTIKHITASGRTLKPTHTIRHEKVTYVLGDLENKSFVDELFEKIDCVIHAAALSSPWGDKKQFESANVKTQINLIENAKKHGVKRFIFISTPSLYFEYKDAFNVKEEDPLPKKFVNEYAKTKRKAELLLIDSGIPFIILRPRALIGRGDTVIMPRLIKANTEGKLKIIGNGKNMADLTSVENAANAIVLAVKAKGAAVNEIYHITNGKPIMLWKVIRDVLQQLGKKPPVKKVPFKIVKTLAKLLELKSRITNSSEPTLTQYGVGTLAISMTLDISKAKNLLGYEPKVTTKEAIHEFVKWTQQDEQ
ncbi:NAD-dependent epimerase/dehydratase family protein [Polaribacter litorisediminis]|uniref:NAD-dependent epimerase/dehydratase family protein n=1 Tax=Polaribacter litorisediminis TaxID=1908341 RepID=UPI001CBD06F1|nr:NAD-dependent epimerase/dehydratase family protein [Polaribacter litorisediminis]UAM99212.1 NAD-dependent epimerase/dehydratase family protein [Polaribacter litorisediminis]